MTNFIIIFHYIQQSIKTASNKCWSFIIQPNCRYYLRKTIKLGLLVIFTMSLLYAYKQYLRVPHRSISVNVTGLDLQNYSYDNNENYTPILINAYLSFARADKDWFTNNPKAETHYDVVFNKKDTIKNTSERITRNNIAKIIKNKQFLNNILLIDTLVCSNYSPDDIFTTGQAVINIEQELEMPFYSTNVKFINRDFRRDGHETIWAYTYPGKHEYTSNKSSKRTTTRDNSTIYYCSSHPLHYELINNNVGSISMDSDYESKVNIYTLEDITQTYIHLKFDISSPFYSLEYVDDVFKPLSKLLQGDGGVVSFNKICISFGPSAIDLSGITPAPDETRYNAITYNDRDKIQEIIKSGLDFHVSFPEQKNKQEFRLFFICMLLTYSLMEIAKTIWQMIASIIRTKRS